MTAPIQLNFSWGQRLLLQRKGMRIQLIAKQADYEVLIDMNEAEVTLLVNALNDTLKTDPHGNTA
jgi:hypothetical protein